MYEKYNKKIYEIKPICPSICPPKPSKPHQIRKEYYPPKPRAEGSSPSAPARIDKSQQRFVDFTFSLLTLRCSLFSEKSFWKVMCIR